MGNKPLFFLDRLATDQLSKGAPLGAPFFVGETRLAQAKCWAKKSSVRWRASWAAGPLKEPRWSQLNP